MDKIQFCPVCKIDEEKLGISYAQGFLIDEDELYDVCPECGCKQLITYDISSDDVNTICDISEAPSFLESMIKLKESDPIEYALKMSQLRNQVQQQEQAKQIAQDSGKDVVKCPKCGSTNIQIVPRKWSLLTGFLTNKTDRVCVNCKHKF